LLCQMVWQELIAGAALIAGDRDFQKCFWHPSTERSSIRSVASVSVKPWTVSL
jgi:hypothetical protein